MVGQRACCSHGSDRSPSSKCRRLHRRQGVQMATWPSYGYWGTHRVPIIIVTSDPKVEKTWMILWRPCWVVGRKLSPAGDERTGRSSQPRWSCGFIQQETKHVYQFRRLGCHGVPNVSIGISIVNDQRHRVTSRSSVGPWRFGVGISRILCGRHQRVFVF